MHEVLVNRLGGLSLPRKSVVRLTDRPDMTLDVYRGRKTTNQQNPAETFRVRVSTGSRIILTVSAGSHFLWMVISAGSKRSETVSVEAKYDRQTRLYPVFNQHGF